MYSREPMDRQREQAVEVLLAMEGQCRELVIDCRQGMLGKQGCQVTVLRREHILSLLQELNRLYDSGIPRRELNDDKEEDDENCCFSWIYEFDFFLQESGFRQVTGVTVQERVCPYASVPSLTIVRWGGEDLWTLARRYCSSEQLIRETNGLTDDAAMAEPPQYLLIPKTQV
jgi:hypothetical protein